jgi:hypothetical protein
MSKIVKHPSLYRLTSPEASLRNRQRSSTTCLGGPKSEGNLHRSPSSLVSGLSSPFASEFLTKLFPKAVTLADSHTAERLHLRKASHPTVFSTRSLKSGTLLRPLAIPKQNRYVKTVTTKVAPTPKKESLRWYRDSSESFVLGIEDRVNQLYRQSIRVQELLKKERHPKLLQELKRLEVQILNETKRYLNSAL